MSSNVDYFILKAFPSITPRDLIGATGQIKFDFNYEGVKGIPASLFWIKTDGYYLKLGFSHDGFYIERNNDKLEIDMRNINGWVTLIATWMPDQISALVMDLASKQVYEDSKITAAILPPNKLIKWARKNNIIPVVTYSSEHNFFHEVINAFQSVQDKITHSNMYHSFWNVVGDERTPKHENNIHDAVHGLLTDIEVAKNLEIRPRANIANGEVDYLVSGTLDNKEKTSVCVEFKNAHSDDLEHGLISQLPKYMQEEGCDYGIYCVLFYKCKYWDDPKKYSNTSYLIYDLHPKLTKYGLQNKIRIVALELGYPMPPSKI